MDIQLDDFFAQGLASIFDVERYLYAFSYGRLLLVHPQVAIRKGGITESVSEGIQGCDFFRDIIPIPMRSHPGRLGIIVDGKLPGGAREADRQFPAGVE